MSRTDLKPAFGVIARWGDIPALVIGPDMGYPDAKNSVMRKAILLADASASEPSIEPGHYPVGSVMTGNFTPSSAWQIRPEDNE